MRELISTFKKQTAGWNDLLNLLLKFSQARKDHLHNHHHQPDLGMADLAQPSTQSRHFRRKRPGQLQRHQRRAAERRRQNLEVSAISPFDRLYLSTTSPTTVIYHAMNYENDTQHSNYDTDERASRPGDSNEPTSKAQ